MQGRDSHIILVGKPKGGVVSRKTCMVIKKDGGRVQSRPLVSKLMELRVPHKVRTVYSSSGWCLWWGQLDPPERRGTLHGVTSRQAVSLVCLCFLC